VRRKWDVTVILHAAGPRWAPEKTIFNVHTDQEVLPLLGFVHVEIGIRINSGRPCYKSVKNSQCPDLRISQRWL
jgi:hypothetical protein